MRAWMLLAGATLLLSFPLVGAQAAEPAEVGVGMYLLSVGNYDPHTGTYDADLYAWFRWDPARAPDGYTPDAFEFVNGAASATLLTEETDDASGMVERSYRVQGTFRSHVDIAAYPFDREKLEFVLEDGVYESTAVRYVALEEESGVSPDVEVSGWTVEGHDFDTRVVDYPFLESYSRVDMHLHLHRTSLSTVLNTFFPPLSFVILAGLTFLMSPSSLVERVGAATGALISAVLFQAQIEDGLPFSAGLILFDKVMFLVYAFILGVVAVSAAAPTLGKRLGEGGPERVSRRGGYLVVALTALVGVVLAFV